MLPPPVTGAITISSVTLPPFTIPTTPTTKAPKPPVVTVREKSHQDYADRYHHPCRRHNRYNRRHRYHSRRRHHHYPLPFTPLTAE